jgi:hypothetical protein
MRRCRASAGTATTLRCDGAGQVAPGRRKDDVTGIQDSVVEEPFGGDVQAESRRDLPGRGRGRPVRIAVDIVKGDGPGLAGLGIAKALLGQGLAAGTRASAVTCPTHSR